LTNIAPNIQLSTIDEERFGIRAARAFDLTLEQLPAVTLFCRSNAVNFLIARCAVSELSAVQAMEAQGFLLMDTLIYFGRRLPDATIPPLNKSVTIRPVLPEEAEHVTDLAIRTFQDYRGHYHADNRLDRQQCDAVYSSWAYRSCISRDVADEVLVAEQDGTIQGFITLKLHNADEGEFPLYGVDPSAQGLGIGRNLVIAALQWFASKGVQELWTSTQITNLASQKLWIRLGFEPKHAHYTFHKWFD
jgi:ribosomal protein S18 acetylase RimI-like enzyme